MHIVVRKTKEEKPLTPETSCSDCKIELIEKKWNKILMNWLTRCVNPTYNIKSLTSRWLVEITNKYKDDICEDDIDRALLCTDDLEPFLRYKYPILRLKTLSEDKDRAKLIYIMTSVLLYHCCINSQTGRVEEDLCNNLSKEEREFILKFCEYLSDMEMTINNVETGIRLAHEYTTKGAATSTFRKKFRIPTPYGSATETTSDGTFESLRKNKKSASRSVTIMASPVISNDVPDSTSLATSEDAYASSMKFEDMVSTTTSEGGSVSAVNICQKGDQLKEDVKFLQQRSHKKSKPPYSNPREADRRPSFTNPIPKKRVKLSERSESSSDSAPSDRGDDSSGIIRSASRKKARRREQETVKSRLVRFKNSSIQMLAKETGFWSKIVDKDTVNRISAYCNENCFLILLIIIIVVSIAVGAVLYHYIKQAGDEIAVEMTDLKSNATVFEDKEEFKREMPAARAFVDHPNWAWSCQEGFCTKVLWSEESSTITYPALSRCILLCSGPQIWPYPIGKIEFGKKLVALATDKLEYKFDILQSEGVSQYLGEAFKLFIGDLARLERSDIKNNHVQDIEVKKMQIVIVIDSDPDPRVKISTDESYLLIVETIDEKVKIKIESPSFPGARNGLETLTQMILLDQHTGCLITLSKANIKDAPSYRYRGLMLDTARNYIPLPDILRTVDAMATCKLNTFHWRITDAASFPLYLPSLSNLFENGAYSREMAYTKEDIQTVVTHATVKGIRILLEVALPGPLGRAWSWSDDVTCHKKKDNLTCDNAMCTYLKMTDRVFDLLEFLYGEIISMTHVDDIFHLSNGVFSLTNCFVPLEARGGFLERALDRLRMANKGFRLKLPIIWYSPHLVEFERKAWERFGVQVYEWPTHASASLKGSRVIHSSKWDLSCELKKQRCTRYRSWQEMYSWNSWRTIESFSIEGGEALLWTDLVDSGNLDFHLWPRAAAVAERLWSDLVINTTVTGNVFYRLDNLRWRMLLQGVKVEPIWPVWCSFNPKPCFEKLQAEKSKKRK